MNSPLPADCKCGQTFTTDTPYCLPCCAEEFGWNTPTAQNESSAPERTDATDQYEMFRAIMQTLMAKTKEELKAMLFDPECPPFVSNLIKEHPALLGEDFKQPGGNPDEQDGCEECGDEIDDPDDEETDEEVNEKLCSACRYSH